MTVMAPEGVQFGYPSHPAQPAPGVYPAVLPVSPAGRAPALFTLAFVNAVVVVATLGLYRFWWRARLRRWLWSGVRLGPDPLVYHGTGFEKFVGFLVAVVILAVLLLVTQLSLAFVGMSYFDGNPLALNLSLVAILPFYAYAQYKSRAYLMSRTSWAGIRFGLEPGAFGYVARFVGYSFLTVLSLGLLAPLQQFRLERYLTDRTRFGALSFRQNGTWRRLLLPWVGVWAGVGIPLALAVASAAGSIGAADPTSPQLLPGLATVLFPIALLALVVGPLYYRARSFSYLYSQKQIGAAVRLQARLRARSLVFLYLRYLAVLAAVSSFVAVLGLVLAFTTLPHDLLAQRGLGEALGPEDADAALAAIVSIGARALILLVPFAFLVIALYSAAHHAFFLLPTLQVCAAAVTVCYPAELYAAAQRPRSGDAQADGFADALDVGSGW